MTDNHNGHNANGEWSTLTLPDSGAVLEYRRVSHMLLADASNSLIPPEPPVHEVDYGGRIKKEANPNAPSHIAALAQFRQRQSERVLGVAVMVGVRVEVDQARVAEMRAQYAEVGIDAPTNDKVLYVTRVLCETGNDLTALRDAIIRKSQPTEEAVADNVKRFPAPVSES